MPANIVKSLSKESGESIHKVEALFKKAITSALASGKDESDKDFYPYVTGVLKKMLKVETPTVNTSSAGNVSSAGGQGNFADKMGTKKKKKKTYKDYINNG